MPIITKTAIATGLVYLGKKVALPLLKKAGAYLKKHTNEIIKAVGESMAKDQALKHLKDGRQDADTMPDDGEECVEPCPHETLTQ